MKTILPILKIIIYMLNLLLSIGIYAQQGINYQGVARDAQGDLMIEVEITLDFNINEATPNGTTVYAESHVTNTDANGVFSVLIGNGSATLNLFEDINWASQRHFLNVSLQGEEVGTTEFMSVPYSKAIGNWQAHGNGVTTKGTGGSIYIGDNAGELDNLDDNHNIGIGDNTLVNNTTGVRNIAFGEEALYSNETGTNNFAAGYQSLHTNTQGLSNVAIGIYSLHENRDGFGNIGIGGYTLTNNTIGRINIAIGDRSGYHNTTGENNIAIGEEALFFNTTGSSNIAIGAFALKDNVASDYNIAIGRRALESNTMGVDNVALGYLSLSSSEEGGANTAIGSGSMRYKVSGDFNTVLGHTALRNNATGFNNVAIGSAAGFFNQGSDNIFLGTAAGLEEEGSNKLYIENSSSATPLIYGEFDNDIIGFNAKVGIGTQSPNMPLHITTHNDVSLGLGSGTLVIGEELGQNIAMDRNEIQARNAGLVSDLYLQNEGGNVRIGGAIVQASDRRLKRDIEDISYGLYEIIQLRPTEYFWKGREQEFKSLGLIAQEVDKVIKNVVDYSKEEDKYGVNYTELIPVLIKAIQEQQLIIETQQKRNNRQSQELSDLNSRIEIIESKLLQ
ncbi:tail fiber domain-containing protein [Hanstruepera marina]|uniref:tail fiber domain-containing protein n=1 Tax=Hanstruepera marina TaxID=2873265 RepID=UPI001CA66C9F|nr:tail fiber domain-containing protein [Hanstruepera marina]